MSRPTLDRWALSLAVVVAERATCLRRSVGCVLLDQRGRILATGYNGVASGMPHCNELVTNVRELTESDIRNRQISLIVDYPHKCAGTNAASGTNLDGCEAVHAEQNALLQCRDPDAIYTAYVTVSPCITCVKSLRNTGCKRIVFAAPYAHDKASSELWLRDPTREWLWLDCS